MTLPSDDIRLSTNTHTSSVTSQQQNITIPSGTAKSSYYIIARAWTEESSGSSTTTTTSLSAPTGVSGTAGNGQVSISWSSVSGATSYNIYWSTISGVTKTTGTKITGAASPYTHTGLTNNTIYYYIVTAVNSYGESSESSIVSATPTSSSSSSCSTSITSFSVPSSSVVKGKTLTATYSVTYNNIMTSSGAVFRIYLSTDNIFSPPAGEVLNPTYTGNDTQLGSTRISTTTGSGSQTNQQMTVTIPSSITAGSYYLIAYADEYYVFDCPSTYTIAITVQ